MVRERIAEAKMLALKDAWEAARIENNYTLHIRQHHFLQLREIAADAHIGIDYVRIVVNGLGGRRCPSCTTLDERVLSLKKEQSSPTLPVDGCSCTAFADEQTGFCLCYYESVLDDELEI
jgi:hypothetical protein